MKTEVMNVENTIYSYKYDKINFSNLITIKSGEEPKKYNYATQSNAY